MRGEDVKREKESVWERRNLTKSAISQANMFSPFIFTLLCSLCTSLSGGLTAMRAETIEVNFSRMPNAERGRRVG